MSINWRIGLWERTRGTDRIWIDLPFEHKDIAKGNIPGLRWNPDDKTWHAALDWEVAKDIRRAAGMCGAGLTVVGKLADWARSERERIAAIPTPNDAADLDKLLPVCRRDYPALVEAMASRKPWQVPGAQFIADQRNVIVADLPGLGKTAQTLAAIAERNVSGPILVVSTKSAIEVTWPGEIRKWLGPNEDIIVIGVHQKPSERRAIIAAVNRNGTRRTQSRVWVLIGSSYLRIRADVDDYGNFLRDARNKKTIRAVNHTVPELFSVNWSAVIVDESHETLAGQSPGVGKRKWSAQRLGLDALNVDPSGMRIAISGTPFRGKTENIFGTLQWLHGERFTSYWNFVKRHYGVTDQHSPFGASLVKGDMILDEKRFFEELRPYMVRRTHEELRAKGLMTGQKFYGGTNLDPSDPNSPVAVWLPMTTSQNRQYKQIVKDAMIKLDGNDIMINGALAEMVRFKQIANATMRDEGEPCMPSNKIEWLLNFLDERKESGVKVLVASQFTKMVDAIGHMLHSHHIKYYKLTGNTSAKDRVAQVNAFQSESGHNVFLFNTKAGGTSITLDAADEVVIVDQTWIPDEQQQVENRAYGRARDHDVTIYYLASLGTIDEDIAVVNQQRTDSMLS
jgi:SNF2 family DNA or RNA helicase